MVTRDPERFRFIEDQAERAVSHLDQAEDAMLEIMRQVSETKLGEGKINQVRNTLGICSEHVRTCSKIVRIDFMEFSR